jgi:hypothetical protein
MILGFLLKTFIITALSSDSNRKVSEFLDRLNLLIIMTNSVLSLTYLCYSDA